MELHDVDEEYRDMYKKGHVYEGANFMINGLPDISIKYFSELASIIILS